MRSGSCIRRRRWLRWIDLSRGLTGLLLLSGAPAALGQVDLAIGELESDGSITIELDVTIDDPVTPGTTSVANQGSVSGTNFTPVVLTDDPDAGGTDDPTVTMVAVPIDLVVSKAESIDPVVAGSGPGNLVQTVTVTNNSTNTATGTALSEVVAPLPAGATLDSAVPSQGSFTDPAWSVGTLGPGAFATLTLTFTVDATAAAATDAICDTATVTAINEILVSTGDDSATECTSIAREVDLQVAKTESADPVVAGSGAGNLTYTVTVTNGGPSDASGVALSEVLTLPAGVTLDSVTPSQGSFTSPTWTVGDLAAGADAMLTVVLTVGPTTAPGTDVVCNTATVTGANESLVSTGDDSATECTSVDREVDLQVAKVESVDPAVAGSSSGNLTYTVTVTNAGPSDASGVTLSEVLTLPAGVSLDSVTPSQGGFVSPTWTVGDLAAGADATLTVVLTVGPSTATGTDVVCNTATVTGSDESLVSTGDDAATECTSVDREVDLQVTKVESVDPAVAGSGTGNLTYTVTVTNAGPSDASGVTLSEVLTLPAGVSLDSVTPSQGGFVSPTWTVGDLAAGADATLTVVLTVGPVTTPGTDVVCNTASVTGSNENLVSTGDDAATECTSVALQADLHLTKTAVPPSGAVAPGETIVYTLTVTNDGPSAATGVVVSDTPPAGVTFVTSAGDCAEGASGVPTCTLGTIASSGSKSYTIEVTVDATPPTLLTNSATVAGNEPDPDPDDNTASVTHITDDVAPTVVDVDTAPGDGSLESCETVQQETTRLRVTFSEAMRVSGGVPGPSDADNPASYLLVAPGPDQTFNTESCGVPNGDDVGVAIDAVTYAPDTPAAPQFQVTLHLNGGTPVPNGLYRLLVCGSTLEDPAGNPLDGDGNGSGGDDFVLDQFRIDAHNLVRNGHFDCDLDGFTLTSAIANEITWSDSVDADGSPHSGSAWITNLAPGIDTDFELGQCMPVQAGLMYEQSALLRIDAAPLVFLSATLLCQHHGAADCSGPVLLQKQDTFLVSSTGGFVSIDRTVVPPAGARGVRCRVRLRTPVGASFDAFVDQVELIQPAAIFADGFESGNTSAWSSAVP